MTTDLSLPPLRSIVYPLGFVFSPRNVPVVPEAYVRPLGGLPLYTHPRTRVAHAGADSRHVLLLGLAVHQAAPELSEQALVEGLLDELSRSERAFLDAVDPLVGRFALLYMTAGTWKATSDAIGLRSIYYTISDGGVVAGSHAHLVWQQRSVREHRPPLPGRWGYPGAYTAYEDVFLLTPNTSLDFARGSPERFYPSSPLPVVARDELVDLCLSVGRNVLTNLLARSPVAISLTAGIDSRVTLALAEPFGDRLRYFTYWNRPAHSVDVSLGQAIADRFALSHQVVTGAALDYWGDGSEFAAFAHQLRLNSFGVHDIALIPMYCGAFSQWETIHVRSNMYEIGRADFQKRFPVLKPTDVERATEYYARWAGARRMAGHTEQIRAAFDDYFVRAQWNEALPYVDASDLYFWEHRMPSWQSNVLLESDCVFETAILLNSRDVMAKMAGQPVKERIDGQLHRTLMSRVLPELLDYPVNPTTWP